MGFRSKYRSRKITVDGVTYDSAKEYRRFCELSSLEQEGTITELQRQVKFILIPTQREQTNETKRNGKPKQGKLLEKECAYLADFVYKQDGQTVVEDTKGYRTKDYIIKRKLMLYIHGIRIREI